MLLIAIDFVLQVIVIAASSYRSVYWQILHWFSSELFFYEPKKNYMALQTYNSSLWIVKNQYINL